LPATAPPETKKVNHERIANGITIALLALLVGGCAWVRLSEAGKAVRVASAAEVASCEQVGATHSKTSERAGIFARDPRKIDQEVEFLARNEAANMGGDTIVPQSATSADGRRSFDVYRCAAR
jgi:hypothetical protein